MIQLNISFKNKNKAIFLMVILLSASTVNIFLIADASSAIINSENMKRTKDYSFLLQKEINAGEIIKDSSQQINERMISKEIGFTKDKLHYTSKSILSNSKIDLEVRFYIANKISEASHSDNAILFLIATEISSSFEGEIISLHDGYLVFSDRDWCVFIGHDLNLKKLNQDYPSFMKNLATRYNKVLLASCNSFTLAQKYENVQGFIGKVNVGKIIECLTISFCPPKNDLNIIKSSLIKYELYVSEGSFVITSPLGLLSLYSCVLLNFFHRGIPPAFSSLITLETGNTNWGVTHINRKIDNGADISNNLITEILTSWRSLTAIILDGPPNRELSYSVLIFKFEPQTSSGRIASVHIGIHPDYDSITKLPFHYTIYTVETAFGNKPDATEQAMAFYIVNHASKYDSNKQIHIPTILTSSLVYAPGEISGIPVDSIDPGLGNPTDEKATEISGNAITELLSGTAVETVILWIDSIIISFVGSGTKLYYALWITVVALILAALIAIVVYGLPLLLELLAYLASSSFAWTLFQIANPSTAPTYLPKASLDIYPYNNDTATLDYSDSELYDNDNDAIPNIIERNYFELYIKGTPDEPIYSGLEDTWLDPNEDYDGDGLLTITEYVFMSDPFLCDTDEDGLNDNEEIKVTGTSYSATASLTDFDKDGELDTQNVTIQGSFTFLSNPNKRDSDNDGLGDLEETIYGTEIRNPDTDGDGMKDGWEVYANLIGWDGIIYESTKVNPTQAPTNPTNWASLDLDEDGLNNSLESFFFTNPNEKDTDGDLLPDDWEISNDFDPTCQNDGAADHDEDGIPTGWEVYYNLDPMNFNDGSLDFDGDGLSNLQEYNYGTNPNDGDCDDDGLDDYEEAIIYNTNPYDEDSDEDGLDDYEEVYVYGTNPIDADPDNDLLTDYHEKIEYGTDPFNNDTDGDGILDSVEAIWGTTDPLDPDSDGDDLNDGDEQSLGTDPNVKDTDGDGMWDGWEVFWGFNPLVADSSGNPDQDGLNNGDEFAANTNPFNNDTDGDGMRDGWEVNYNMDPTNPANWDNDPDGDGIINLYEYLNGTNPRSDDTDSDGMTDDWELLYGLDPTEDDAQGDLDGDGLKNVEEFDNNTDPTETDSDDDGMDDDWEVDNELNPLSDDASLDPDTDGLTNLEEYIVGTDPQNDDCDSDNLKDGEEVTTHNTDPWDADSDDDDMPDGWEVNHSLNPLSSTDRMGDPDGDNWRNFEEYNEGTNPQNADTDGDGMDDGWELTVGTNPLVADANADPDSDDLVNEDEYYYETDPFDYDTDGDGFNDGIEVNIHGTDPTDPNDYPYSGGGGGGFG